MEMKKEKGQSLVEFALVLPLLLLLLFGIVDFGRVFHAYLTIDHVGREVARAVSVGSDEATINNIILKNGASINLTRTDVDITPAESGHDAEITIQYPITFLTPVIGDLVGPLELKDSTTMRVE